jgi:hypothetical protein
MFANSGLLDPLTMPPVLLKAHQELDAADDAAYQPSGCKKSFASNAECEAFWFRAETTHRQPAACACCQEKRKTKATES